MRIGMRCRVGVDVGVVTGWCVVKGRECVLVKLPDGRLLRPQRKNVIPFRRRQRERVSA